MLWLMAGNQSMLCCVFRFRIVSVGKVKFWGKGESIYNLDRNLLDIGTLQWEGLRERLRLTGAPGERENDFI